MDDQHVQQLKKSLLEEKNKIETELGRFATKNPAIKGDWTSKVSTDSEQSDSLDEKAHDVTNFEERRAVEQNLELRLKEIEQALTRLDTGTYGTCSNCSQAIDQKRLVASPVVRHCFSCASKITFT